MSEVNHVPFLEVKDLRIIYKTDLETVYAVNGISFMLLLQHTFSWQH